MNKSGTDRKGQGRNAPSRGAPGQEGSSGQRSKDPRFTPPAVSLPKGGGAIQGIGEKRSANPVNGTGSLTIPLPLSPGRSGFTPSLALDHDSGAGNGPCGLGWRLGYPSITRRTDRGIPRYLDREGSDVFVLSGADDLVPALRPDGTRDQQLRNGYLVARYRPRIEGTFARIERWTHTTDPTDVFWRTISRENLTSVFGRTPASRIADPADPARIFSWLPCETFDDRGNASIYEYVAEDGSQIDRGLASESNRSDASRSSNRYLKRVKYGNRTSRLVQPELSAMEWLFELVLDYGDHEGVTPELAPSRSWPARPDPFSVYRAGFEVRTYRRCQRILMFHRFAELGAAPRLVRSLELDYNDLAYAPGSSIHAELAHPGSTRHSSILRRVTAFGYADSGVRAAMPPLELTYSRPRVHEEVQTLVPGSEEGLPIGVDGDLYQWVDLHGEGLAGVLSEQGRAWWYKPNLGDGRLGPPQLVARRPSPGLAGSQLLDLAGDGSLDLVQLEGPVTGFFERDDQGWSSLRPFTSLPELDWRDPNLRFVDLTGDGRADLLITHDDRLHWHPSLGEDGFGPRRSVAAATDEARGPRLVLADATETIFLADLTGDGLSDLVRIRHCQICYWPNLGYGRFGPRVTMDHAPVLDTPERFDPRRVRLADIDGSGTTDLIYLGSDGVCLYFNRAGNGWTAPYTLSGFPRADGASTVHVTDLRGNGTACLVWSSKLPGHARSPLCYVDLMGGKKPHLLVGIENNLGARTVIEYAASTRFYLEDQRAGRPWITRLPFPVHVVERVITYDEIIRNRFVTRYAYHHGHFDGVEREFRGFGMVEQIDTEELAALSADPSQPPASNVALASHVPPVLTRTWYHTGLHLGRDVVSRFHAGLLDGTDAGAYYREPGLTDAEAERLLLEDTALPPGLTAAEEREACRALKGAILRQEIYALDGTDRQPHPYSVTEQNVTVRMLQPMGTNPHAVFFTHPRESLAYHYERRPADPRVTHSLVLETDEFGNVLRSAAVAYGRRQPDPALEARDQAAQAAVHVVYSENPVTNDLQLPDDHRAPLPAESRTYELTGLARPAGSSCFTLDQLRVAGHEAAELPYEQEPAAGVVQKRLIERGQILYRRNDLTAALPLGQLESMALPFETYQLAFTPGLVSSVYGARVTEAMLAGDGGYVHRDGDPQWWIPSGRAFLSPGDGDTAAVELAHARQHFFLPCRYQDPFGHTTAVAFDGYDLLFAEARDALDNRTTVGERDAAGHLVSSGHDYRVLQPRLVTDANGNRVAASFDALGAVVGTAVMGKRDEVPRRGDLLDGFVADLPEETIASHLALPLEDPHAILGRATSRVVYDRFAYQRTKGETRPAPTVVYVLARETHDADLATGAQTLTRHSFSYFDGFGREIQRKSQAEPAPAPAPLDDIPDPSALVQWVGTGWSVFNNKGLPVRQFEPFFTSTHRFESEVQVGVGSILCYDPIGRVVAAIRPDHAWEKHAFDAWRKVSWDANDTALIADPKLDPDVGDHFRRLPDEEYLPTWYARRQGGALGPAEQAAAAKTAAHAGTPSVAHIDPRARTFLIVAHNRFDPVNAPTEPAIEEHYATHLVLDIEGNQRAIVDARSRTAFRYDHDMVGRVIHQASMEAGERWTLADVGGMPIHVHDSRGHHSRTEYDAVRRPVRAFVRGAVAQDPAAEIVFGKLEYGEGQAGDAQRNLRGRLFRRYDGAGVVTNDAYDFKGNPLRIEGQLAQQYKAPLDWSAAPTLEPAIFASTVVHDALDRPISMTTPDASVYRPGYNEGGMLERVDVHVRGAAAATPFVVDIDYDAKGQRQRIEYGNQVETAYTYDPLTFRLVNVLTTRLADQVQLQDLTYTHDAVGNITQIEDAAQQTVYFNNGVVTPSCSYVYDATYRLIRAEGREHIGQALQPAPTWNDQFRVHLPQPGDGQAMRRYREHYRYDAAGNLLELIHKAAGASWTRGYTYAEPSALEPAEHSNRLTSTAVGTGAPEAFAYDAHGNVTAMAHLTLMQWDCCDHLCATARQAVGGGAPETTYYVYDAAGRRVRKVTERQNGTRKSERTYLGGTEIYREYDAAGAGVVLERGTLHVMDDERRIALVETRVVGSEPGVPVQLVRYQHDNHLGSATLELDELGQTISYEEYYPFGATSYQAARGVLEAKLKRYRYTRMERDEETGFAYHGARYCAPWLGRWIAPDPAGPGKDGANLYVYVGNDPIGYADPTGLEGEGKKDTGPYQWAKSKEENDLRYQRLIGFRKFVDKGQRTGPLEDFLNRSGDLEILKRYGYERSYRHLATRKSMLAAIEAYLVEYDTQRSTGVTEVKPETIAAIQQQQRSVVYIQRWNEGWGYVSQSVFAGVSAKVASMVTDDQEKIVAAAGAGAALSGAVGAAAPAAAKAYVQRKAPQPAIQASTPAAIYHGYGKLSQRQAELLATLPKALSSAIVPKSAYSLADLAALTAHTGVEFTVFTRGPQRMIIRGKPDGVGLTKADLIELRDSGWKWSGHTHPGVKDLVLDASGGDREVLKIFGQERSLILNSRGARNVFDTSDNRRVP